MNENAKQNIELLSKLGYEYDESKDQLYCTEYESYLPISLEELGNASITFKKLISLEKKISFEQGKEHAKFNIRYALGLEP